MLGLIKKIYEKMPVSISTKIINIFDLNPYYSKKTWDRIKYIEENYNNLEIVAKLFKELPIENDIEKRNLETLKKQKFMDSENLRNEFDSIVNTNISGYYTSTGGTSGSPTKLYLSDESYYQDVAHVVWGWSKLGYRKGDRKLTLRGVDLGNRLFKYNPIYNELQLNVFKMDTDNIDEIVAEVNKFKPVFGHGYPSSFFRFAQLCKGKKMGFQFKAISLTSENMHEFQREYLEQVFDCKVRNFWGHSERAAIAIEKETDKNIYYLPLSYGLVEIIKEDGTEADVGEEGEITCTSFINKGMKLIRYRTGDYATVNKIEGGLITEITNIKGRHGKEFVKLKTGEKISTAAINIHSSMQYEFKYVQLYQENLEELIIRVVPWHKEKLQTKLEVLKNDFQRKLEGITVKIVCVEDTEIYKTHRGKIPYLITKV